MTWFILARGTHGRLGVAVAGKFLAVGALCADTRSGVGAATARVLVNPLCSPAGQDVPAGGLLEALDARQR